MERILAHSDVAPGRKIDPGPMFPWRRLAEAGIGHFADSSADVSTPPSAPGDTGAAVEMLQSMLQIYGYGSEITGVFDTSTQSVVEAFQLHFRQARVDGIADAETVATLHALLAALPADPTAS
jgi:N-acetylmuramoyl-L-alanine amidase